jgi:hypothetical protein
MSENAAKRDERLARSTFCYGTSATCLIPTLRDSHDGELLGRERSPFQLAQSWPSRVRGLVQCGKLREDSFAKLTTVEAQVRMNAIRFAHGEPPVEWLSAVA